MKDLKQSAARGFRMLRNLAFDVRSGGLRRGAIDSRGYEDASDVVNSDVTALERIFRGRIRSDDVLVDVGCGKGRVLSWWASQARRNRIVGLEISEEVALETRRRLRKHQNVVIVSGDAVANIPEDGTLFFVYNPFGERTVRSLSARLREIAAGNGRFVLLYYNPVHADVFRADPAWSVEDVSIGGAGYHPLCVVTPA